MNKVYVIVLFVIILLFISCSESDKRIKEIGYNIIELSAVDSISNLNPNYAIPDVVNVGQNLFQEIHELNYNKNDIRLKVTKGDAKYPIGDGGASNLLIISEKSRKGNLTIRLKYNEDLKLFEILGFYTNN